MATDGIIFAQKDCLNEKPEIKMDNPYQTPASNPQRPTTDEFDTSSPFSSKGRFSRLSYIAWAFIPSFVASIIAEVLIGGIAMLGTGDVALGGAAIVVIAIQIVALIVTILFAIRRLHDFGSSGWWLLLILVPVVNIIFGIYMLVKRGDENTNRYAAPRPSRIWERIVAYIAIGLIILSLIGILVAIMLPAMMNT